MTLASDTIPVIPTSSVSRTAKGPDFQLVLSASLASPSVNDQTLQATSIISHEGGYLVTYNSQGETYAGGIDFVGNEWEVRSQVLYPTADIHAVSANKDNIFLAGARDGESSAFAEVIQLKGNQFSIDLVRTQNLGSYAANSITQASGGLLVTTGSSQENGGGLYQLSSTLEQVAFLPLHDARWVVPSGNVAFVGQGTPGQVTVVNTQTMQPTHVFAFDGANEQEAKTTVELADGRLFVAGGTAGVFVLNPENGQLLHHLAFDESEACTTNAVSAEKGLLFISNGAGGAYVASYNDKKTDEAPELLGKLGFENNESVNHILYRANKLYVAAGMGGTKVLEIKGKK